VIREKGYAQCFSQEEEIGNVRYEKRGITEKGMYKGSFDGVMRVEERKGWEEKKRKFSRGSRIIMKEDVRIILSVSREGYDEYLENMDD